MGKYKSLEKDLDEEFKDLLLDMTEKEFTEYFKRLFKDYYEVLFTFDNDLNRYEENTYKKYEIIRKVKNLVSFKYNNLDNFENLERLKLTEDMAYTMMNELYFIEKGYSNLIYHDRLQELNYINETLANLIEFYKEDSSEKVLSLIEDIFKRTDILIRDIKKLPVPESEEMPKFSNDIMVIDETNYFSYMLKEQLEEFDSILNELKEILPEEVIDEYEDRLYSSERMELLNLLIGLKDNDEDKEEVYKLMAMIDYYKPEEPKYLYEILNTWN